MTFDDGLRSPHVGLSLLEILQLPTSALLGVNVGAADSLEAVGIRTVFDLGTSALFAQAVTADGLAAAGLGDIPRDLLNDTVAEIEVAAVPSLPLSALRALTTQAATDLQAALDVQTIKELANWPPRVIAHAMVGEAAGTRLQDVEDAAADKLRPQLGEYPTERVYFNKLVMLGMPDPSSATALSDPLSLDAIVDQPLGFGKPAIGGLAIYAQSWFAQGITLGQMVHSLALAPGEATRIAVVDWSRRSRAASTESIDETERLNNSMDHSRAISEVQNAVANEMQSGGSMSSGWAHSESDADNSSLSIGGGLAGASAYVTGVLGFGGGSSNTHQESDTSFGARSASWSVGSRSVMAGMSQHVNDRTEQHASSVRNRRASAVREVSQSEHEQVSTRVVANYNHMHALTVQYYEVVQIYRAVTELHEFKRVIFVPFSLLDFTKPNADSVVSRFRGALLAGALTPRARALLLDVEGSIEVRAAVRVDAPIVMTGAINIGAINTNALAGATASSAGTGGGTQPTSTPAQPAIRKVARPGPMVELLPGDATLVSLSFEEAAIDRVRVEEDGVTAAASTFYVPPNTDQVDFTGNVALRRVTSVHVATSDGHEGSGTLFVRYQTRGRQFSFSIPIELGSGTRMQRVAYFAADAADRRAELMAHLQANRGYYTQVVLRNLDSASLIMLLSAVSWLGKPLADQIEPNPIAVTGNYLVLGAPAEDGDDSGLGTAQQTWGELLRDRDIVLGRKDKRIIPIPTGGVFAEAVLGRSNSAEKLDITRFWNWQDSPIPLQPTEIAPIVAGSRVQQETLTPGQFGPPVVNVMTPTSLPDPAGVSAALGALANGSMFRDMSGLAGTQAAAQAASAGTLAAATDAGRIASENYRTATQQATEMGKAAAEMWKVLKTSGNGSGNARTGGPGSAGISGDGARVNQGRDMDRRGVTDAAAPSQSGGTAPRVTSVPSPEFRAAGGGSSSREVAYSDEAVAASPYLLGSTAGGLSAAATSANVAAAGFLTPVTAIGNAVSTVAALASEWFVIALIEHEAKSAGLILPANLELVPMRYHDNHVEFTPLYSAWTNSAQHIYINLELLQKTFAASSEEGDDELETERKAREAQRNTRAAALLTIRHELAHVAQFVINGTHPGSYEKMIEFEREAYTKDADWLAANQTFLVTTIGVTSEFVNLLAADCSGKATKFQGWKTLTTESERKAALIHNKNQLNESDPFLPATLHNKPNYDLPDLYKTKPPP